MPISPDAQRAKVALAVAVRTGDHAAAERHRTAMRAYVIRDYIRREVAKAPALTDEQREMIAALLRPGGAA